MLTPESHTYPSRLCTWGTLGDKKGQISAEAMAANRLKFERRLILPKHLPPKSEPENPPLGNHSFR